MRLRMFIPLRDFDAIVNVPNRSGDKMKTHSQYTFSILAIMVYSLLLASLFAGSVVAQSNPCNYATSNEYGIDRDQRVYVEWQNTQGNASHVAYRWNTDRWILDATSLLMGDCRDSKMLGMIHDILKRSRPPTDEQAATNPGLVAFLICVRDLELDCDEPPAPTPTPWPMPDPDPCWFCGLVYVPVITR
jgi:hypothetical protein